MRKPFSVKFVCFARKINLSFSLKFVYFVGKINLSFSLKFVCFVEKINLSFSLMFVCLFLLLPSFPPYMSAGFLFQIIDQKILIFFFGYFVMSFLFTVIHRFNHGKGNYQVRLGSILPLIMFKKLKQRS